jgi:hypothetical protein
MTQTQLKYSTAMTLPSLELLNPVRKLLQIQCESGLKAALRLSQVMESIGPGVDLAGLEQAFFDIITSVSRTSEVITKLAQADSQSPPSPQPTE